MRKIRLWISYLLMLLGGFLFYLAYRRSQLPYNAQGRHFEKETLIVYHEQSIDVFVLCGIISILIGFLIWSVTARF